MASVYMMLCVQEEPVGERVGIQYGVAVDEHGTAMKRARLMLIYSRSQNSSM
jgi:hypothetical protein